MKKKLRNLLLFTACIAFFWVACDEDDETDNEDNKGPGAFSNDYETSSAYFTNMGGMVMGNSPHGEVQIWYTSNIKNLIETENFTVPEGTVSVKKFDTTGDGTIDGLVVMIKKESGYDSENNDWYYETRAADGTLLNDPAPGKIEMCITCHQNWKSKDYLGGTEMK